MAHFEVEMSPQNGADWRQVVRVDNAGDRQNVMLLQEQYLAGYLERNDANSLAWLDDDELLAQVAGPENILAEIRRRMELDY